MASVENIDSYSCAAPDNYTIVQDTDTTEMVGIFLPLGMY